MRLTPATRAWEAWRTKQNQRRRWVGWSSSVGAAMVAVALLAWGGFHILALGEKGEAVAVKLGNPEGENLPLAVQAVPDPSMQALLSAQREAAKTVEETRVADSAEGTLPASTAKPVPAKTPSPTTSPTSAPPAPSAAPKTPQVTEKIIKGDEKGNPYELVLKPQGEKISQNVWTPVWLFMPLPASIDPGLIKRIQANGLYSAEERRDLLRQAYPDGVTLKNDTSLVQRPALWEILESSGYDVANADYKRGKTLNPVIITFELGVPQGESNPALQNVQLQQSSGSRAVDDAVLYAFQRSTFANGTGQTAQGRYTYNFDTK
jgi:outer membrane biosynthesis protein TonB